MRPGNGPYDTRADYYGRMKVTLNIDPKLHDRLVICAKTEGYNRHSFMLKLLEEGIVVREKKAKQE